MPPRCYVVTRCTTWTNNTCVKNTKRKRTKQSKYLTIAGFTPHTYCWKLTCQTHRFVNAFHVSSLSRPRALKTAHTAHIRSAEHRHCSVHEITRTVHQSRAGEKNNTFHVTCVINRDAPWWCVRLFVGDPAVIARQSRWRKTGMAMCRKRDTNYSIVLYCVFHGSFTKK